MCLCCAAGSGGGFYQWSRGVQIRANLDLLMDWVQSAGLGDLALEFFRKLSAAVNVLATPKENLLQVKGWSFTSCLSQADWTALRQLSRVVMCLEEVSVTSVSVCDVTAGH
jgi:hypothetical protein